MIGPGFFNLNAALAKTIHFSERVGLQLRLETVNTTNTPQFANPNGSCCTANNANFGFVTGTRRQRLRLGQLRHRRPSQRPNSGEVDLLAFESV